MNSGNFMKLEDGQRVKGVFRGDPKIFRTHWIGGRSHLCTGRDTCEHCKAGDKSKFRFLINFVSKVDGVWMAKVFEQGYGVYKDLKEMHENDYDLENTCITLSRSGKGTDTRYSIIPTKNNGDLKPADFKALGAVPLNPLSDDAAGDTEASDADEDAPF